MVTFGPHDALGTKWWVEFYTSVNENIWFEVKKLIDGFEADYSRFQHDSLVGRLNKSGQLTGDFPELFEMLRFGQSQYLASKGTLNILTGGRQVNSGYGKPATVKPEVESEADPVADLEILPNSICLKKGAIDLGAFGKGWLLDKIKTMLLAAGFDHFLVNGGGDLYVTSKPGGLPVEVYVEHPVKPGFYLAKVPLLNQSLAVSSSFKRSWQNNSQEFNHLHVNSGVAAHVVTSSGLLADTMATRLCLNPSDESEESFDYLLWRDGQAAYSAQFKNFLLV